MGEVQNPKTSAVADIPEYLDPVYQRAVLRGLRDGVVRGVKKEKNLFISAGAIFTWYQLQGALQRRSFNHRISQFCNPNPNAASNAWKTYQDFIHRSSPLLSSGTRRFVTYGASYGVPLYLKNEALQGIDPKSEGANSLGPRIATDVATLYLVDRLWAQNAPGIERFLQNHPEFCGGPPVRERVRVTSPSTEKARQPTESPSRASRIGWGILGGLALLGAAALAVVPFDGPAGELALGSAAFLCFSRARGSTAH